MDSSAAGGSTNILDALQVALQSLALPAFMYQLILRLGKLVCNLQTAARQRVSACSSAHRRAWLDPAPRCWQGRGQERAWRRAAARGSRAWRRVCGCGRARGGRTHVVRHAHAAGEGSVQADVAAPVHFEPKLPRSVVTTQLNTKTIAAATQDHQQGHPLEVGTGKSTRRKRRAVCEEQRARAAPARWTQRCNAR